MTFRSSSQICPPRNGLLAEVPMTTTCTISDMLLMSAELCNLATTVPGPCWIQTSDTFGPVPSDPEPLQWSTWHEANQAPGDVLQISTRKVFSISPWVHFRPGTHIVDVPLYILLLFRSKFNIFQHCQQWFRICYIILCNISHWDQKSTDRTQKDW